LNVRINTKQPAPQPLAVLFQGVDIPQSFAKGPHKFILLFNFTGDKFIVARLFDLILPFYILRGQAVW
jgi:hypothetical protein